MRLKYHRKIHSTLGVTPLDAWLSKCDRIKTVDPCIDLDKAFYHKTNRKVYRDSIISVNGMAFEVPSILIGRKVDISYDPTGNLNRIFLSCDNKDYGEARPMDIQSLSQNSGFGS